MGLHLILLVRILLTLLATILSVSMMLRYSLNQAPLADKINTAVNIVLDQGL